MKKALSIVLSLAMLLSLCAVSASAAFPDVRADHSAQAAIERWSGYGLILGNEKGDFLPDGTLTRASLAVMLDRLMGYQVKAENTFGDMKAGAWYCDAVLRLNAAKVLEGADGKAMPEAEVTRQEAAALTARALGIEAGTKTLTFTDASAVADWAKGSVSALVERGCFKEEKAFRPTEKMTRAETVTMLDTLVAAFVNKDGEYSADAEGDVVVNAKNVTLKNMKITGNLIIADGVADGDVSLDKVTVSGKIILRGGGANSFHLLPGTVIKGAIIVTKTASGGIRLVNESGKVLPMVNVADGKDGVTLEGKFDEVIVATDAPIAFNNAEVSKTVSVTVANANVSLTGESKVAKLDVTKAAEGTKLEIGEKAKVTKVDVAANGLTLDNQNKNSKPSVTVDKSVTEKPADSKGEELKPSPPSGGDPYVPSGPTVLTSITANLASPQAAKTATDAVPAGSGYTVTTAWSPTLVEGKFAKDTAYTATLVFSLASSSYVWGESAPTVTVNNSTSYGASATVGDPVLDKTAGTVTVTAAYAKTAAELAIVVDAQPQNVSATAGNTSAKSVSVTAHTTADGQAAVNYLVSHQWYGADNAEMTGKTPVANAVSASYQLPANLTEGTYYYACGLTADGVTETMSTAAKVEVAAAVVGDVVLSNLRLEEAEYTQALVLAWDTNQPESRAYQIYCYVEEEKVSGQGVTYMVMSDKHTRSMAGLLSEVSTEVTVDRIEVTPWNMDTNKPCGAPLSFECSISLTETPMNGITVSFDQSTNRIKFQGIPNIEEGEHEFHVKSPEMYTVASSGVWGLENGIVEQDISDHDYMRDHITDAGAKAVYIIAQSSLVSTTEGRIVFHRTEKMDIHLINSAN